jgi:general secretion pathway protein M
MVIRDKWQQLSLREQRLVMLTGVVVMLGLWYFAIWQPLNEGIEAGRLRLRAQQQTLQQLVQDADEVKQLRARQQRPAATGRKGSLLVIIERSARRKNLHQALQKVQPEGSDGVRIWLDNVAFDDLIDWLDLLSRQRGFTISEISIERENAPGRVSCRLLLRAG